MFKKKIIFLIPLIFIIASCGNWDSVKRGLTGSKAKSTDEFLVQKKDPLILPPDYENLPIPSEKGEIGEEVSSFERTLTKKTQGQEEEISSTVNSSEESIKSE